MSFCVLLLVAVSATEVGSQPQVTTVAQGICSPENNQCSNNICVEDANFFAGFRCCKKSVCLKSEGRYCPDPGNINNATRIPGIRKRKYPFQPKESVVYKCVEGFAFSTGGYPRIVCKEDGTWMPPQPNCHRWYLDPQIHPSPTTKTKQPKQERSDVNMAAAVGIVSVAVLLILAIAAWCTWRKFKGRNLFLHEQGQSVVLVNNSIPVFAQSVDLMSDAISAEKFNHYVALRHLNNDQKFVEEFEEIQNLDQNRPACEASSLPENKDKNRYTNIVAYDHTRVKLHQHKHRHQTGLHRSSDYINANYVSSYDRERAYIACQGPLPSTYNDFWKMIWENNVTIIVMITNLVEKGRRKCDQYWPQEGKEQYKHVSVVLKETQTFANYIIRHFAVKNNKLGRRNTNERKVLQFHFTQWPDHGTPEYLLPVLTFIRRSSSANGSNGSPIVVHCSAGVGRTGTYIVIHSMMQMFKKTGKVDINKFLRHIRLQRNHLVQTEDQYVFVHDALLEYITSGITECSLKDLPLYYESLLATTNAEKQFTSNIACANEADGNAGDFGVTTTFKTALEKQFMKVVYLHLDHLDYEFATRTVNEMKNRPGAILPVFRSRVLLCNRTSAEGSDYINASFVQGYRSSHEFIVTQLPLANTRKDFWQLIWDHNVPTVITLIDEDWNSSTDIYWPTEKHAMHCSSFNVSFESETILTTPSMELCSIKSRDFILEATKDDYILEVKQFEITSWNTDSPTKSQLHALKLIHSHTTIKEGTTVIQDRCGSTSAIQLACWHLIHSQLNDESMVDIYQTAMLACQMRPRVFTSPSHLKFLYEAVLLEARVRSDPAIDLEEPRKNPASVQRKGEVKKRRSITISVESNVSHADEQRLLDDDSTSPIQSEKTEISDDICQDDLLV
uniref:protein-tyrosine-phosphatase n=1 Tax=Phallusia mammillata TaxID=59560 RepID=A0A6F9DQ99_9ASCI|nr:receptor-type tyrosine-protein phosphatase gamma-like [Phallusia mammillata]